MNLLTTLSGDDSEGILQEVERGEKASLLAYSEILNDAENTLPPTTEKLLTRQRDAIEQTLNTSIIYHEVIS